jgi:hypothetical protein
MSLLRGAALHHSHAKLIENRRMARRLLGDAHENLLGLGGLAGGKRSSGGLNCPNDRGVVRRCSLVVSHYFVA